MSQYFYSATERGFYFAEDKTAYEAGKGWPSDAVPVSDDDYLALFTGQQDGKLIIPGEKGYPVLAERPAPTQEAFVATAEWQKADLRALSDSEITWRQDAVDAGIATDEETAALAEWKKYRVLLMRVDTSTAPEISWPGTPS